ncbi:NAD(P)-dependent oxidoreductase [Saccharopolyspora phatthalungensis]|uniref:3-hydroxyisobutyrate dehydrogenase n=1 Tax=Saccharopolyspora phatthalungensis TaxID=664693 RepID=A0A840QJ93_9PSEU|nr:NAD(P)-dependent oxidoreductase [Saccharopolyspora phatthalungensis]MBB5158885.1 3-hydroxyisobutyrate dehydrogenase [Saccharopolyspora phatthalungensis]
MEQGSSAKNHTAAVLGLGTMGGRVAARLREAGAQVSGYDLSAAAKTAAAEAGVRVCDTPEEAVQNVSLVVLSLPLPKDVIAAAQGPLSKVAAGTVVIDLSTIDPASARTAAQVLGSAGAHYLDAPVLGRPERCGNWTLAVGGDAEAVDRVRPILEGTVATRVAHVGEVGTGSVVKLLNNLMFGAINAVTAEAINISRLAGLDPEVFAQVVADSGAATVSGLFRDLAAKMPAGDYSPTFALGLLRKDNRLALELANSSGSPAFIATCVNQINNLTASRGWSGEDTGAVHKLYELLSAPDTTPNTP